MITHVCELCSRGVRLDVEMEPERCIDCDAVLCAICFELGCCRVCPPGPPCANCEGRGAIPAPGPCSECKGTCSIYDRELRARQLCPDCEGQGVIEWSECRDCGGYGHPSARPVQKRSA